jgi:uncharacterized protein (TIGR03382 family)
VFWVLAAFAVIAALAGAEAAEAVDYIQQFSLYKTRWNSRAAGERPVGTPYGTSEVLPLRLGAPLVLYADVNATKEISLGTLPPNTTIEKLKVTIEVVNNEQSLGIPAVTVTVHYDSDVSDPDHGTLTITAKGVLEMDDVLNVQLKTRIEYSEVETVRDPETQKVTINTTEKSLERPSNLIALRVGYDSKQGGGGCNAAGTGAVFLLPLILLALSRAKRK